MGHPNNSRIQALLDGELNDVEAAELEAHVESCERCRDQVEYLHRASAAVGRAFHLLDTEPDLATAWAQIRSRWEGPSHASHPSHESRIARAPVVSAGAARGRRSSPSFLGPWSLPKAASITLLLTGALVSALPGSPVRRWIAQGWEALTGSSEPVTEVGSEGAPEGPALPPPGQTLSETGAGIPASTEGVEIWIHGLRAEAGLRILWTDGEEAWIYAGEGTRFNSTDARLEAFSPPGAVRVEIPRNLQEVVVGLDGRVLLRKSQGEVEILAPVRERGPSEIRFEAPGAPNDGRG